MIQLNGYKDLYGDPTDAIFLIALSLRSRNGVKSAGIGLKATFFLFWQESVNTMRGGQINFTMNDGAAHVGVDLFVHTQKRISSSGKKMPPQQM